MAYFEKRTSTTKDGRVDTTWRVRFKYSDGEGGSESGFPTKAAAERWNEEDEAATFGDGPPQA
ncbi:hypothetical protein ACFY97_18560 [Streptomyces klenkii]|uniref:hypothetical protein n=1 Tax=Streptomyces klenkii TaxID=1420899 RepID=UPI0036EA726C